MKRTIFIITLMSALLGQAAPLPQADADELLKAVDDNLIADHVIIESTMIISSERGDRSISSKTWKRGPDESFTEYLAPAREKGIKMLKIKDDLWSYYPDADRIIKIAGHMLRQSVMGSDLSYEDMMENRKLQEMYGAKIAEKVQFEGRDCYVMKLDAKLDDVAYPSRKLWVDESRQIPLRSELYAKTGKLLKLVEVKEVKQFGKRWYPTKVIYKNMLATGKGTVIVIQSIAFDQKIPSSRFNKSSLAK